MKKTSILVLGAGELGTAILESLLNHPRYSSLTIAITLLVRPSTLASPSSDKKRQLDHYQSKSIALLGGDTDNDSEASLTQFFRNYDTVISAGGFTSAEGTQLKLAHAVITAGVKLYFPWQYGLDYDVIGPAGGGGLFAEQCRVREVLRGQKTTQWVVVSVGIFMSFFFEDFWGVVRKQDDGRVRVTALGKLEDKVTTTTAEDIGRSVAELTLGENQVRSDVVFIAGETLTYAELAQKIEDMSGSVVVRDERPMDVSRKESEQDPENKLKKYWLVFSEGKGYAWDKEDTWNAKRKMQMTDVNSWLQNHWK